MQLLDRNGVELLALQGASRRGTTYRLPIVEGHVDPAVGGEMDSAGVLMFKRGRHKVVLRHLMVKTNRQPLTGKAGGGQLKLAKASDTRFDRRGFGFVFTARGLSLSEKLATRLSKKLHLHDTFEEGQPLGTLRSSASPATVAIEPSGAATVTPDPAFLAKLDSLFVSLNPIAPAERAPGPTFSLPFIPAGTVAPTGTGGVPRTGGSLEFLQLGSGQVFWHELWLDLSAHQVLAEVDIEPSPTLPGKLGQVPIADLGQGVATADPEARTVTVNGAPLTLQASAAGYFNQAFNTTSFTAGETVGSVSFTAQTE